MKFFFEGKIFNFGKIMDEVKIENSGMIFEIFNVYSYYGKLFMEEDVIFIYKF